MATLSHCTECGNHYNGVHHCPIIALRAATEVLEDLRRGHGIEVGAACFPALNLCRDALEQLRRFEQADTYETVAGEVAVHRTPNFRWIYTLQPGDSWTPHPAGGILVVNPERKPLWCHVEDGHLVQEWLEPAGPSEVVYFRRSPTEAEDCLVVPSGEAAKHVRAELITRVVPL